MSFDGNEPEATNALFEKTLENVPPPLRRATLRMEFPPSYVLVGVYRLFTDKNLYKPAWDKCNHGTRRGAIVGAMWVCFVMEIYRAMFLTLGCTGVFDLCDSEKNHTGVPIQVRPSPILFFLVLIRDIARQKYLDYRMIRCSASKFHSISTLVSPLALL